MRPFYPLDVRHDHAGFISIGMNFLEETVHLLKPGHAFRHWRNVSNQTSKLLGCSFLISLLLTPQMNHLLVVLRKHIVRHKRHPIGTHKKRPKFRGSFLLKTKSSFYFRFWE